MILPAQITVSPGHPLRGSFTLPGDKSLSHRAALCAALAEGESRIENFLVAGVTNAMLDALTALGVDWDLHEDVLHVRGGGLSAWQTPAQPFDCGSSATSLRLLAGALAASGLPAVLDGSPGLRRRPMGRILEPLRQMGVNIQTAPGDTAPLTLHSRSFHQPLSLLDYTLPIASAQVKSCLLLAALAADGVTTLSEPGPSRDHTERMLRTMGVQVESALVGSQWITRLVPPAPLRLSPLNVTLPGDLSAAAFLIVAALITPGSEVRLCNVGLNPTRTGLLDVLERMGAHIEIFPNPIFRPSQRGESGGVQAESLPAIHPPAHPYDEPSGDLLVRHSRLQAVNISGPLVVRMIDEFPAFAIAAAFAEGESVVSQAEELRFKESDRIGVLVGELRRLGVQAAEHPDGFSITGGSLPTGGRVDAHGDHRLAMALALTGLVGHSPVTVTGAQIIAESFPEFPQVLCSLGADLQSETET